MAVNRGLSVASRTPSSGSFNIGMSFVALPLGLRPASVLMASRLISGSG